MIKQNQAYRCAMKQVIQESHSKQADPNYTLLIGMHEWLIKECQILKTRIDKQNNVKAVTLIYSSRLEMMNNFILYAGLKSQDDLYSQPYSGPEWQLIKEYTEELVFASEEKCRAAYENIAKKAYKGFLAVCKTEEVFPNNEKKQELFMIKESQRIKKNQTDQYTQAPLGVGKQKPANLRFGFLKNFVANGWKSDEQIFDDYRLLCATPNYATLRMTMNLGDATLVKVVRKLFMVEGIKTNHKIWIKPDIMDMILKKDVGHAYKPLIAKGGGKLVMDAAELIHRKIGSEQKGDIMIRLISNLKLRKIKRNLGSGSYEKRIDLWNKLHLDDAQMFDELDTPSGMLDPQPEYVGSIAGGDESAQVQEESKVKGVWEGVDWDDTDEDVVVNRPNAQEAIVGVSAMNTRTNWMPETQPVDSPKPINFNFQKNTVDRKSFEDSPLKFFMKNKTMAQSIGELPESDSSQNQEVMQESKILV
jgi:hypothetical protein